MRRNRRRWAGTPRRGATQATPCDRPTDFRGRGTSPTAPTMQDGAANVLSAGRRAGPQVSPISVRRPSDAPSRSGRTPTSRRRALRQKFGKCRKGAPRLHRRRPAQIFAIDIVEEFSSLQISASFLFRRFERNQRFMGQKVWFSSPEDKGVRIIS